jgi:hypothetical protein
MQTTTDYERRAFCEDAADRGLVPYQLRHLDECDGYRDTEGHYYCTALAFVQEVRWRRTAYLVGVPTCRHSHMRKIVNAVEQFGCDVGWGYRSQSGWWRSGVDVSTFGVPIDRRWFPMMRGDAWCALSAEVTDACEPAAFAGYRTYYWKRDIARAVRIAARRRGRLRCLWCRTIFSWAKYDRWLGSDPRLGLYDKPVLCDAVCKREWDREQMRIQRREWRELEWLREGHRRLVEIRKLVKSPSELAKRRQRPHAV